MSVGRPIGLTPEVQTAICNALRKGGYRTSAVASAGVGWSTFCRWMQLGKKDDAPQAFKDLRDAVKAAEREAEQILVERIASHSMEPKQWTAAAWLLERRHPERWGRRDQTKHDVAVTDVTGTEDPKAKLARLRSLVAALESASDQGDD